MHGGYRPGAGRPRGLRNAKPETEQPPPRLDGGTGPRMSPLEYMLSVMNDPGADPARRDRMAIAAAPFAHQRAAIPAQPGGDIAAAWAGLWGPAAPSEGE
jgi:hypothetical protein